MDFHDGGSEIHDPFKGLLQGIMYQVLSLEVTGTITVTSASTSEVSQTKSAFVNCRGREQDPHAYLGTASSTAVDHVVPRRLGWL